MITSTIVMDVELKSGESEQHFVGGKKRGVNWLKDNLQILKSVIREKGILITETGKSERGKFDFQPFRCQKKIY